MNICTAANSNYVKYLYVMLAALLENNAGEDIRLYVLQRDFTDADRACISGLMEGCGQTVEFPWIDEREFASLPTENYPLETNFRLALTGLLPPSVERLLYLDVDILVRGSLRELYDADLGGRAFGACQDFPVRVDDRRRRLFRREGDASYFNAGVMLWDMARVREKYPFRVLMDAAAALGGALQYPDQDILNYAAYGDVAYLDARRYNYMATRYYYGDEARYAESALIFHYAGCGPWLLGRENALYRAWWDCAARTPFYPELLAALEGYEKEPPHAARRHREIAGIYRSFHALAASETLRARLSAVVPCALYGAGQMAEMFWDFLEETGAERFPAAVMDAHRVGQEFHGLRIRGDFGWAEADREYLLLVTPAGYGDGLAEELARRAPDNVRAVPLLRFLNELETAN